MDDRCANCRYFHELKHNFQVGKGYEKSNVCDVLFHHYGEDSFVLEVKPDDICEMYERKNERGVYDG